MGRYIDATGTLPTTNLFLYTMEAQAPFFDQPWLAQSAMYWLRGLAGDQGLLWLRNASVAGAWVILMVVSLSRARDARSVGVAALVAVLLSGLTYGVRTQMFALIPYALFLWMLFFCAERRIHWAWGVALVPLGAFWANTHGSFILGPALVLACGLGDIADTALGNPSDGDVARKSRIWGVAAASLLVGSTLTPHGVGVFAYAVDLALFSEVSRTVTEWRPPAASSFYGIVLLAALAVGSSLLAWRRREVRLWEVVLFAATAYLAASAIRNFYWFAGAYVLVLAPHIRAILGGDEAGLEDSMTSSQSAINGLLAFMLVAMALSAQPASPVFERWMVTLNPDVRRDRPAAYLHKGDTPLSLMQELADRGYSGRLFHSQAIGGLVEFALAEPDGAQVAFVDQRMELIPEPVWHQYFALSRARPGWEQQLDAYDIQVALVSSKTQRPLTLALESSPQWRAVGRDGEHVLFVRADSQSAIQWRSTPSETREPSP